MPTPPLPCSLVPSPLQSIVALRLLAGFQRLVLRNDVRAAEISAEADRVEEGQARADHEDLGDRDIFSVLNVEPSVENVRNR